MISIISKLANIMQSYCLNQQQGLLGCVIKSASKIHLQFN